MLAVVLLALGTQTSLADLARHALPIALVRVEQVHVLAQEEPLSSGARLRSLEPWPTNVVRLADATVERRILGSTGRKHLRFTLRTPGLDELEAELRRGDRALVFLDGMISIFHFQAGEPLKRRLRELCGPRGPTVPLSGGIWPVDAQGWVRVPARAGRLPEDLEALCAAGALPLDALIAWLEAEVARTTPALVATAPSGWSITLEADGAWHGSSAGRLERDALDALWRTMDELRFRELPGAVGTWDYPHQSSWGLRVRAPDGEHWLSIYALREPAYPLESVDELDAFERGLRAWSLVPGDGRPDPPRPAIPPQPRGGARR